jgi:hypothetical protein
MKAPFAESIRGVQIHLEIAEKEQPARLVARRTVVSGAPNHDGLEEALVVEAANITEFLIWLGWLAGDYTCRWLRLGREDDIVNRVKLNSRQRFTVQW